MNKRTVFLLTLSLVASIAVPLWLGGVEGFHRVLALGWMPLVAGLALLSGNWVFRGLRLAIVGRQLSPGLDVPFGISTAMAIEFAALTTPGGAGGHLTLIWLASRRGLRTSQGVALLAFDQLFDLIIFLMLLPVALMTLGSIDNPGTPTRLVFGVIALGIGTLVLLALVHLGYRRVGRWLAWLADRMPWVNRHRHRFLVVWIRLHRGLRQLLRLSPLSVVAAMLTTLGMWICRYGVLIVIVTAMGETVGWGLLFMAQVFGLMTGQLVMLPGGGGGVEVAAAAILGSALQPAVLGAAILSWRFVTFHGALMVTAPVFVTMGGKSILKALRERAERRKRAAQS